MSLTKGLLILLLPVWTLGLNAQTDTRCYELRVYTAHEGKLNDLMGRFRNHTCALFEKHGMTNVGYWTPLDNPDGKLYYILSYPSRAARDASWATFREDSAWIRAKTASEVRGPLVKSVESVFLTTTPYSPHNWATDCDRVWELRIYTTPAGKLDALNTRFKDHTMGLFAKHGMQNIQYWTPADEAQGASTMLYYFVTHQSPAAAAVSWKTFVADPVWQQVARDSETRAGGSIVSKIESVMLYPTDFSPVK
ncbi:MAG: NIPSNAP family protein [Bacteroidia bacterium]|jgi:hypothetical protein|nr:NIPSNAP family protein [Bacteroidia bacterium]